MTPAQQPESAPPLISIVTATYNASHLLRYAVSSVLQSSIADWEMIIVGDHCTDDTEQVIAGFGDHRISFHNLATNSGQQATPNNVGIARARGKYLCFLNQDDMFLADHLESMLREVQHRDADIICARYAVIEPFHAQVPASQLTVNAGGSLFGDSAYHPSRWYIASCWFMLRDTAQDVGQWSVESSTLVPPSQEWLFRAYRQGKAIVCSERVSLVVLYSGARKGAYRKQAFQEHAHVFKLMASEDFGATVSAAMVAGEQALEKTWSRRLRRLYARLFESLLSRLGVHPLAPEMMLRYGGKGGFVRNWKKATS